MISAQFIEVNDRAFNRSLLYWRSYRQLLDLSILTFSTIIMLLALISGVIQAQGSSIPPADAQPPTSQAPTSQPPAPKATVPKFYFNILYDDDNGHNQGWVPDNGEVTFLINDTRILGSSSFVNINTNQPRNSDAICGVTFIIDGHFEVTCDKAPGEGAQLRYDITNTEPLPPPTPSKCKVLQERYENGTVGREMRPLPGCPMKTTLPILAQN